MIQRENEMKPLPVTSPGLEENLYDLSILQEMDDREYIIEIVSMFLNDTPKELKAIKEALTACNTDTVYKIAHKLKSSAGILQAHRLIYLLTEIERIAKSEKSGDKLANLFDNVQQQYKDLESALQKLLKNMRV